MLKAVRDMIRRLGFVGGVLLTLAFAAPAFAAHVCADELSPPVAEAAVDAPASPDQPCPDCGPACANGCCHAPHSATAPETLVAPKPPLFATPVHWVDVLGHALDAPAGPDRPPRL
ncbi:hypothetical protein ACIQC9_03580 [Brevundimonas sp. NPDC092305]|uniref:hypothetical protein n=1 Tax=Brevundimonas sp. NPDC092305 TaxID=3363957 RepID=UPI003822C740